MLFQIKEIVLWPRNPAFPPRRVAFALGKVTVISGASRTGKSAVIPIIDYCLGAHDCSIPVKTIRDSCSWFGVIVRTSEGEKLFARREPGEQRSTDEMFLLEAPEITEVPQTITKNTTADGVRRLLDELAGLSKLNFTTNETSSGFEGRLSFRDLSAFVFQPQNVIANPEVLFFKTDRYEHREKLRRIFPYILGAVTAALLGKQHELNRVRLELRRKESELKKAETVSAEWMGELQAKVSEALELGLLADSSNDELTREQMLARLQEIVERTDATLAVSATTISDAVRELNELEGEESAVSHQLTSLRRRLTEMGRIQESAANYREALRIQRDRLQISDWLGQHRTGEEDCPVCGGHLEPSEEKLAELRSSLKSLELEAGDTFEIPAAFDREMQRVQTEVNESTERLKAIQIRKKALSQRSQEAKYTAVSGQTSRTFHWQLGKCIEASRKIGRRRCPSGRSRRAPNTIDPITIGAKQ
jgi:hypothetical protein